MALTGNVDTQASAAINTLNMGANTLALDTGAAFQTNGILVSGNGASTISGGASLAATTSGAELVIRVDGASDALSIGTPVIANGTNALTKTGAGTLTLSATGNTYSGTTYVDEGTLAISGSNTGNGAYNVNNSGTLTVTGTLTSTGVMTVANGSGNGVVNVNSGANVTIGGLNISNSGTGYDTGTGVVNVNGGTLTSTQDVTVGLGGAQTGKLIINSGTVNVATTAEKWLKIGQFDTVNGEIDINGGTLNLNTNTDIRFSVNSGGGINVINQNGGTVASYSGNQTGLGSANVLDLQNASSVTANNTYNLNGGTLNISQVLSTQTNGTRAFNFNGGTLKNTAASTTFFNLGAGNARANVRNGGAIIDTTNGNVTIAQALLHSNISGDNAIDGGLTKNGTGVLTLGSEHLHGQHDDQCRRAYARQRGITALHDHQHHELGNPRNGHRHVQWRVQARPLQRDGEPHLDAREHGHARRLDLLRGHVQRPGQRGRNHLHEQQRRVDRNGTRRHLHVHAEHGPAVLHGGAGAPRVRHCHRGFAWRAGLYSSEESAGVALFESLAKKASAVIRGGFFHAGFPGASRRQLCKFRAGVCMKIYLRGEGACIIGVAFPSGRLSSFFGREQSTRNQTQSSSPPCKNIKFTPYWLYR